jgi:single-strand DNA-binding protein
MRGLNKVELIGHVGTDPNVHATDDGTIRSRFNVAINRTWNNQDGQRQQATEWVPCVAWGKVGEIVGEYVTKGRLLYVEGRLHTSAWADDTTGEKRYRTEVIAQEVILLDSRRADEHADDTGEAEAEPAAPPRRQHTPQHRQGTQRQKAAPRRRAAAPDADEWGNMGL